MTFKFITFTASALLACASETAMSDSAQRENKTGSKYVETTDEMGQPMIIVKATRDEGYTVHPSVQIKKTADEFHCEGSKVETVITERIENMESRSVDFDLKVNGEKIDLTPVLGREANLFGSENLQPLFTCVDEHMRIAVKGQRVTHENTLAPSGYLIDLYVDRETGVIELNARTTTTEDGRY